MKMFGRCALVGVFLSASMGYGQMTFVNNLMPMPASVSAGGGSFSITEGFAATTNGFDNARLDGAIARTMMQLRTKTGLYLPLANTSARMSGPRLVSAADEPYRTKEVQEGKQLGDMAPGSGGVLSIAVDGAGQAVQSIDEQESYTLTVSSEGVKLAAPTVVGAMRGLATLVQLVQPTGTGYLLPVVTIQDSPRFPWRGLMIDCGRHFEPVEVIKRNLDAMAAVKLNVFHWHLTEDQGFRMESKLYPKLTKMGTTGQFYTQAEAKDVVAYAAARGIRVVPEFEMPGHSQAWQLAYPELASGKPPTGIRQEFGVSLYALDPTREETYVFVSKFLGEMATIFPDPYVHIGGDESPAPDWKTNPKIVAFMKAHNLKDNAALQAYFNTRVLKILTGLHKHMVGWDEILDPALPRDVIIQSWRGFASLAKGAEMGFQGILSQPYYLDGMRPASVHYLADPIPANSTLTEAQRKLILGGETPMWGEDTSPGTIDSHIWPRTAAIAERFWSPASVTDVDDMYRRLAAVSIQLEGLGLHHVDQEDASLRELAGTEDIAALKVFASVIEPVSFGERYQQQKTSQVTVMDKFVDAMRPDPPSRYAMEKATKNFLKNPKGDAADRDALLYWYESAAASVPAVEAMMVQAPRLMEIKTRAEQLPPLAETAKEAMQFLATGKRAPAGWKLNALALIAEAKKPSAVVRFTFADSLTEMVMAVDSPDVIPPPPARRPRG